MGKFRDILDEAEVILKGKKRVKKDVPTDRMGRPLSVTMQRIMKATKEMEKASGFRHRNELASVVDALKKFQDDSKKKGAYDKIKYKYRNDFEKSINLLSNMVRNIKKKGLKAVESNNEEMELWESLENSLVNIKSFLKKR